jgi:hypothetical protein
MLFQILLPIPFNEIHEHSTRRAGEYYVPTCRTRLRQFSINYQDPLFYNALSSDIRGASTLSLFKKNFNLYLFTRIHTI